jgi:predicted adenylyl cyclase CyaB
VTTRHRELELKAVVADAEDLRRRLHAAGAEPSFAGRMTDLRYDRGVELGSRDEVLRVRTLVGTDGAVQVVLAWKGPTMRSPDGYKLREEIELPVAGAGDPGRLLEALGYRAVHAIEREIEIFRLGQATLRLERYPRMDVLVEIEGEPAAIERAIAASGIPRGEFTAESLAEFARRFEGRSGEPAVLASAQPSLGMQPSAAGAEPR